MSENTYKTYDKTKNKLRANFEDVKYLIALHNQLLDRIKLLEEKVTRLYQIVVQANIEITNIENPG